MKAPPIQYVSTTEGTSIAYGVCGQGEPFILMPLFLLHFGSFWHPALGSLPSSLAERYQVITYDPRGQGFSTRDLPESISLDDFILDFDTIRERLGLKRFVLLGSCSSAFLAAHYAFRHPDRVKALILVNGAISWDAWRLSSVYDTLPREDWELFLYNMIPKDFTPEAARSFVEIARARSGSLTA